MNKEKPMTVTGLHEQLEEQKIKNGVSDQMKYSEQERDLVKFDMAAMQREIDEEMQLGQRIVDEILHKAALYEYTKPLKAPAPNAVFLDYKSYSAFRLYVDRHLSYMSMPRGGQRATFSGMYLLKVHFESMRIVHVAFIEGLDDGSSSVHP